MYFDFLVDDKENPKVFFINCKVSKKYLEIQLGYLKKMIGRTPIILKDKRDIPICELELPDDIRFLTQDRIVAEKDYLLIEIKKNYVKHQYFIHQS